MPSPTQTCLICDAPLTSHQARTRKLCGQPACRSKYFTVPKHQTCIHCGRPLSPQDFATRVCAAPECQRVFLVEQLRQRRERERQEHAALMAQADQLRAREAEAAGVQEPRSFPLALIPSFADPLTNLPERRRRAFRDYLMRVISEATSGRGAPAGEAAAQPEPEPPPAALAVLGRACGVCKGSCCSGGGNQAYLKPAVIRRYMDSHPDLRPRDVLAAYLAHVGHRTYQDSCIYHQPGGCALPRDMRSDICNQHFCTGLKEYLRQLPATAPARGFFVSTKDDRIQAAAFIDESEVRLVRVPAPPDEAK